MAPAIFLLRKVFSLRKITARRTIKTPLKALTAKI
jgi:hypothetical protein